MAKRGSSREAAEVDLMAGQPSSAVASEEVEEEASASSRRTTFSEGSSEAETPLLTSLMTMITLEALASQEEAVKVEAVHSNVKETRLEALECSMMTTFLEVAALEARECSVK